MDRRSDVVAGSAERMADYSESLLVHFRRAESLREAVVRYPSVDLDRRQLRDLELLLNRAFYPLSGYMNRVDYEGVLESMRLADGTVWPVPVCLDVSEEAAAVCEKGAAVALRDQEGFPLAVLKVSETWKPDKRREALAVFGTDNPDAHPGVRDLLERERPWYVGGTVEGIHLPLHHDFRELRLTPSDTYRLFSQSGWRNVLGVHATRELHCAHKEMILGAARQVGARIFLQPVVGLSHPGDREHYYRVRCYQAFAQQFPRNMILLGLLPLARRGAGPREALGEAIVLRNFGCSHYLVAPDHGDPLSGAAGCEPFYPLCAAQDLVRAHEAETGIRMVPLRKMVYVEERAQYVLDEELEDGMTVRDISTEELIRRLENGLEIPRWFSYPEVVAELRRAHPPRSRQGFSVFFTGLSGSGKSTMAKVLLVKFMEMCDRPVTLLDGDIVRRNLSSELSYSREHRNLNITRIGFVAAEITKNGGIALCAPIAPYEESRRRNRQLISRYGGYIEVYVSTPLGVCEQRDRKGIYAKARAGLVRGLTGIDDPYVPPAHSELTVDTTDLSPEEAAQEVLFYLEEQGYIE